jgi:hypothetical protein
MLNAVSHHGNFGQNGHLNFVNFGAVNFELHFVNFVNFGAVNFELHFVNFVNFGAVNFELHFVNFELNFGLLHESTPHHTLSQDAPTPPPSKKAKNQILKSNKIKNSN